MSFLILIPKPCSFAVIASLLLLPTLLSGIWGMNFARIPWYNHPYGFYFPIALMIASMILLFMFFSLYSDGFFSYDNLSAMLKNMVIYGILALGITPLIIAGGLDISFGAIVSFISVVMAIMYQKQINLGFILIIGIVIATFSGLINGFFIERFEINPLIFTLGMMSILQALALVVSSSFTIGMSPESLYYFANHSFLKIPLPLYVFILLSIILWFILRFTIIGRNIYTTGANPKVATLLSVR